MSAIRKQIRQAIKSAIQSVYAGSVFTSLSADMQGIGECITVRWGGGKLERGNEPLSVGDIEVGYHKKLSNQDEVDDINAAVSPEIVKSILPSVISGIYESGYRYEEDETGQLTSLIVNYTVKYLEP